MRLVCVLFFFCGFFFVVNPLLKADILSPVDGISICAIVYVGFCLETRYLFVSRTQIVLALRNVQSCPECPE